MPTFKERAISDMRIPGYGGSYDTSYAPAEDSMWGAGNQWNSRANLMMGRYIHTPAGQVVECYTVANPDRDELAYVEGSDITFDVYSRWLPWGHLFVGSSSQSPNSVTGWSHNSRQMFYDVELWQRSKNTGQWTLLRAGQPGNDVLSSVNYVEQEFNLSDSREETLTEGKSYRPTQDASAPIRPYRAAHWFMDDYSPMGNTADVADVLVFCKTSLVLNDPTGTDDRNSNKMVSSLGMDPYPAAGGVGRTAPGVGTSRPRVVTAKWPNWEWLVLHTMTEAEINSVGLPPSLTNLVEGDANNPPVAPPPPPPTLVKWVAKTTPVGWVSPAVTTTPPNKVRRPRRAIMR